MATGTVKWFNLEKGFGFVKMDEDGSDVFVHHSAIDMRGYKTLSHGQKVEFSIYYGPKGLTASYLRPLENNEPADLSLDLYHDKKEGTSV